jgi:cobalamin biosynthesis protein CbiD
VEAAAAAAAALVMSKIGQNRKSVDVAEHVR